MISSELMMDNIYSEYNPLTSWVFLQRLLPPFIRRVHAPGRTRRSLDPLELVFCIQFMSSNTRPCRRKRGPLVPPSPAILQRRNNQSVSQSTSPKLRSNQQKPYPTGQFANWDYGNAPCPYFLGNLASAGRRRLILSNP